MKTTFETRLGAKTTAEGAFGEGRRRGLPGRLLVPIFRKVFIAIDRACVLGITKLRDEMNKR